jgi:hypothetical protein
VPRAVSCPGDVTLATIDMPPSEAFEQYGWLSVQLDQYFAAVRIFSFHYEALKTTYDRLPRGDDWPDISSWPDPARAFFMLASSALNFMGTTQIFSDAPFPQLKSLPEDMRTIGFDTCFCFQWTLFENFVKQRVLSLVDRGVLAPEICTALRSRERQTEQFLRYIDSGPVFSTSPFRTALPVPGWVPALEDCTFAELDKIRRLRNQLIHAPEGSAVVLDRSDRRYERSMWILRIFAGNIDHAVQDAALSDNAKGEQPPQKF